MWLYIETTTVDLKVNRALNKAKQSIIGPNKKELVRNDKINASGQMAIRADITAENTFVETLIFEGLEGILYSEESGVREFGENPRSESAIILLLDPLDGSQNYQKGLPIGCISVAYGKYKENPTLMDLDRAAILNLYSEDLFFGVKDMGAWFNGEPIPVHSKEINWHHRMSQVSFYAYGEVAKRYFFDFQDLYSLRSLGSSAWELVITVIGINDAYIDLRKVLRAHDFIASKIIIEAVGGKFVFLDKRYNDISKIHLDTFKDGYAVVASYHPNFVNFLIDDFKKNGLL